MVEDAMKKSTKSAPISSKVARDGRKKTAAAITEKSSTPAHDSGFPIVGIGASAGGLEALVELFQKMPQNTGLGFVVVTHQHPSHTSMLPELLGKVTMLP
ncbi:MAG: chemotaxis protein CheB, partial [Verrucomicrobia bacterium]|nr:chemotaxis protein CheB [Verrucomicrobiota bacterium]